MAEYMKISLLEEISDPNNKIALLPQFTIGRTNGRKMSNVCITNQKEVHVDDLVASDARLAEENGTGNLYKMVKQIELDRKSRSGITHYVGHQYLGIEMSKNQINVALRSIGHLFK